MVAFLRLTPMLLFALAPFMVAGQSYFPVTHQVDTSVFRPYLPRTLQLLTTDASAYPQQVRILVYGQSISEQVWWEEVRTYLEQRYPKANINMTNKAIGGFSTDRLKLMVENDARTVYPDLVLFHDYGNEQDYELIIRAIRSNTTAEIALQTDHMSIGQDEKWHDRHAAVILPALATKYGLALINVRAAWKEYLAKNQLDAAELLSDHVHLNAHGNYLMAEIVKKHFETLPAGNAATTAQTQVKVLKRGTDYSKGKQSLSISLDGNRVDLVWENALKNTDKVKVLVDGKKPSDLAGCYYYTRPSPRADGFSFSHIGQLLGVQLGSSLRSSLREEDWQVIITAVDSVQQQLSFRLIGTKTGEDGSGSSAGRFVSKSGNIIIEPQHWFFRRNPGDFSNFQWLKPGDTVYFQVKSACKDETIPSAGDVVTVVKGIGNEQHTLTLSGKSLSGIREIRIYAPPLKE